MPSEREEFAQLAGCSTDRTWLADLLTLRLKEEPGNPLARPILTDAQWQTVIAALRAQDREDGVRPDILEALRREAQEQHFWRDLAERTYASLKERLGRAAQRAFAGDDLPLRRLVDTIENPKPIYGSGRAALNDRDQGEGSDGA